MSRCASPFSYVATSVANDATFCNAEYSSKLVSSSVRTSEVSRSEQNLQQADAVVSDTKGSLRAVDRAYCNGRFSIYVISLRCCRNDGGVSATTCRTRIRVCSRRQLWLRQALRGCWLFNKLSPSYIQQTASRRPQNVPPFLYCRGPLL